MALQTCKRCRRRRIKCDLQLPSCSSCQLADTECLFFDDSLGHEVPRSYLHALNVKVQELEAEIRTLQPNSDDCSWQRQDQETTNQPFVFTSSYLGPGSSAKLLDNLLNTLVRRQLSSNPQYSPKFVSKIRHGEDEHSLSFPLSLNVRTGAVKLETQSPQQPQLQRALIEYYAKAVQPKFPLLSPEQLRLLLGYENPLRQAGTDVEKLLIHGMLAVSATLVARDVDREQSFTASLWTERFFDHISHSYTSGGNGLFRMKETILSLCFLTLLDLVSPGASRGSIWEIVGSASQMYAGLCEGDHEDVDYKHIGVCVFAFESIVAGHFHRPSLVCDSAPRHLTNSSPETAHLSSFLQAQRAVYSISQHFALNTDPSQLDVENMIPPEFRVTTSSIPSEMSLAQAQVYLALHPLFTSPSAGPHSCSPELLGNIARAASTFILCTSKLNREHRIISIWITAEFVLQAGAVWGAYLILSKQGDSAVLQSQPANTLNSASSMEPLLQCTALLASFSERWKAGCSYVQVWDAFLEMLWADLDLHQKSNDSRQTAGQDMMTT